MSLRGKLAVLWRQLVADAPTRRFIRQNRRLWRQVRKTDADSPQVLLEYNDMHSAVIAYSYAANVLAQKHAARIVPFVLDDGLSLWYRFYLALVARLEKLYRSFNAVGLFCLRVQSRHRTAIRQGYEAIYTSVKTKRDVEQITVNGIRVGDLLYDHYLRKFNVSTIDIDSERFRKHLEDFIATVVAWNEYLDKHNVCAVIVSHCVYKTGILPRLAISRDIAAYQVNATHVYRINRSQLMAYIDFLEYPAIFAKLPADEQEKARMRAEERLARRFSGEVGVDMPYSSQSAYSSARHERLLEPGERKKVLIATHCFFDSPHPYGINLFPDFYEWLTFLGGISEQTDYDWYLKTHPDFLPGNTAILDEFIGKFPRFRMLPSTASHHQIIDEGVDVVLTVYGTIGFEYAALGVPVINASQVNPHAAYNFNQHPATVEEYRRALLELDRLAPVINMQEVQEFYFMKHIYNTDNWLFSDHAKMLERLGGYRAQFGTVVYDAFLDEFDVEANQQRLRALHCFFDSGDYRLDVSHLATSNPAVIGCFQDVA